MLATTMVGLADYHMHTLLCHHAEGLPKDYVEMAARRGLTEMGFACHSPMPTPFDDWRMSREDLPRYLDMVAEAGEQGSKCGVIVRLGLEVDYLPGHEGWIEELTEMAEWDYLIGSVHYLTDTLVVDHPDHLSIVHDTFTPEQVWERYWERYTQAIRTGFFDIMAHPDLPKKFGRVPVGDLTSYYQSTIDALRDTDTAFEINTAGLRKPIQTMYPEECFVQLGADTSIPLVISSDAHAPAEVGADFDQAIALAKHAGYEQLARFEKRQRRLLDF